MPVEKKDPAEEHPEYKTVEQVLDEIQAKIDKLVAERERIRGRGKL